MSLLVIDLGNTRLKWGWHDSTGLLVGEPVVHTTDISELLNEIWTFPVAPARVLITTVAEGAVADQLTLWLKQQWNIVPEFIGSTAQFGELKNAYAQPEQLGSDRWLAMLEAYHSVKSTVCVVDCGTAVTIDVVDKAGQHLGGMIMPGFNAMVSALTATTNLVLDEPQIPTAFEMASSTTNAIVTGASQSIVSLVTKTLDWLEQKTGDTASCFLTGGDSARLSALLERNHFVDKDLVIKGLVRIASEF